MLYVDYQDALPYRNKVEFWDDAFAKLGAQQPRATDGDIVGESR